MRRPYNCTDGPSRCQLNWKKKKAKSQELEKRRPQEHDEQWTPPVLVLFFSIVSFSLSFLSYRPPVFTIYFILLFFLLLYLSLCAFSLCGSFISARPEAKRISLQCSSTSAVSSSENARTQKGGGKASRLRRDETGSKCSKSHRPKYMPLLSTPRKVKISRGEFTLLHGGGSLVLHEFQNVHPKDGGTREDF